MPDTQTAEHEPISDVMLATIEEFAMDAIARFDATTPMPPEPVLGAVARIRRVEAELEAALKRERILLHAAWALKHCTECELVAGCAECTRAHRAADWLSTNTTRPTPTTE